MRPSKGPNNTNSPDLVNRDSSGGTCFNCTDSIGRGPDYERPGTSAFGRGGKLDRDLLRNKPVKGLTPYPSRLFQKLCKNGGGESQNSPADFWKNSKEKVASLGQDPLMLQILEE
jgi:hypothetical protein